MSKCVAVVKPSLNGLDEIESTVDEAMRHLMCAQGLIEKAKAMTVEVTAFTEVESTRGGTRDRN